MTLRERYIKHRSKWKECDLCSLEELRSNVALVRGDLPCEVLFIGEAPGQSEDTLGTPFVGPAGKLLDSILETALSRRPRTKIAFTNLIGCIPLGEDRRKVSEPPKESIEACSPRLVELVGLGKPILIVQVGKLSEKWVPKILPDYDGETVSITHPAAILRATKSSQGLAVQQTIVTLADAFADLEP